VAEADWRIVHSGVGGGAASDVAVAMITRNRADEAVAAVGRLLELPERPAVVVVDNASSDGTAERVVAAHPEATVVRAEVNLGAAGRNIGVKLSAAPFVAFCDDDTAWAPGSLARAAALLDRHADLAVVCGRVLVGDDGREDPVCAEMAATPLPPRDGLPGVPVLGFLACAAMVRRTAFLGAGGFERRFLVGGEEELLALDLAAAGCALAYVPDVTVLHRPSARRDHADRRRIQARNALWVSWLRHPPDLAWAKTTRLARQAVADPGVRRGMVEAAAALGWVARSRRRLPADVANCARLLHEADRRVEHNASITSAPSSVHEKLR
jgi:GT2 family glycosyltransferase